MPSTPPPRPAFLGADFIASCIQLHTGLVQRQFEVLSEVWNEITSESLSPGSWIKAYGKLLASWTDNGKSLLSYYTSRMSGEPRSGVPLVAFVIDHNTQSSSQAFPVSPSLDPTTVKHSPLLRLTGSEPLKDAEENPKTFDFVLNGGVLTLTLSGLNDVPSRSKEGSYWSTVYEELSPLSSAGAPPRGALALAVVTFITS